MVVQYTLHTVETQPALRVGLKVYEDAGQDLEMAAMGIGFDLAVYFEAVERTLVVGVERHIESVKFAILTDQYIAAVGIRIDQIGFLEEADSSIAADQNPDRAANKVDAVQNYTGQSDLLSDRLIAAD